MKNHLWHLESIFRNKTKFVRSNEVPGFMLNLDTRPDIKMIWAAHMISKYSKENRCTLMGSKLLRCSTQGPCFTKAAWEKSLLTPPFRDEFFGQKTNSPGNAEKHALHLVERQWFNLISPFVLLDFMRCSFCPLPSSNNTGLVSCSAVTCGKATPLPEGFREGWASHEHPDVFFEGLLSNRPLNWTPMAFPVTMNRLAWFPVRPLCAAKP